MSHDPRPASPNASGLSISLKWQVIAFMCLLILAVAGTLGWYFIGQARVVLTDKFKARASLLTETLAHDCTTPLFYQEQKEPEDLRSELDGPIDLVFNQDPSAMHVFIANRAGALVAEKNRPGAPDLPETGAGQVAMQHALRLATNVFTVSLSQATIGRDEMLHVTVPVVRVTDEKPWGSVQVIFSLAPMRAEIRRSLLTGGA